MRQTCSSQQRCPNDDHPTSVSQRTIDCVCVGRAFQQEWEETAGDVGVAGVDVVQVFPKVRQH